MGNWWLVVLIIVLIIIIFVILAVVFIYPGLVSKSSSKSSSKSGKTGKTQAEKPINKITNGFVKSPYTGVTRPVRLEMPVDMPANTPMNAPVNDNSDIPQSPTPRKDDSKKTDLTERQEQRTSAQRTSAQRTQTNLKDKSPLYTYPLNRRKTSSGESSKRRMTRSESSGRKSVKSVRRSLRIVRIKQPVGNVTVSGPVKVESSDVTNEGISRSIEQSPIRIIPERKMNSEIIDACDFANAIVLLLRDGTIIYEEDNAGQVVKRKVNSNVILSQITVFSGYLYGVGSGTLYYLDNGSLQESERSQESPKEYKWKWLKCAWAPIGIISINSTHDGTHIWIQTEDDGLLYDSDRNIVVKTGSERRVYGNTQDHWINVNSGLAWNGTLFPNIVDAVIDHRGIITVVNRDNPHHNRVRLVRWKPYFLQVF